MDHPTAIDNFTRFVSDSRLIYILLHAVTEYKTTEMVFEQWRETVLRMFKMPWQEDNEMSINVLVVLQASAQ